MPAAAAACNTVCPGNAWTRWPFITKLVTATGDVVASRTMVALSMSVVVGFRLGRRQRLQVLDHSLRRQPAAHLIVRDGHRRQTA